MIAVLLGIVFCNRDPRESSGGCSLIVVLWRIVFCDRGPLGDCVL